MNPTDAARILEAIETLGAIWDAPEWEAAEAIVASQAVQTRKLPSHRTLWVRAVAYTLRDRSVLVFEQMGPRVGLGWETCFCIDEHDTECESGAEAGAEEDS